MTTVNELSALSGSPMSYLVYALLLRTKIKHFSCSEIMFIRDIKPLYVDGNFICILYFSTSSHLGTCPLFVFVFVFSLKSRPFCFYLVFKADPALFPVAFFSTRFCGIKKSAFPTMGKALSSARNSRCKRLLFSGSVHIIC